MKQKSQKQQILELLQEGWYLTKIQILDYIGCFNSGARIEELRNRPPYHRIKTRMETNKMNGKKFAVYYMPEHVKK